MEKKYIAVAKDFHSPLVRNEIWASFSAKWPNLFDLPKPEVGIYSEENAINYIIEPMIWSEAKRVFQGRVQEKPSLLADVIENSEKWGQEMNEFTSKAKTNNLSQWSAEQLVDFYSQFTDLQSRQYAVGILLPLIDIAGVSFLEEFLNSYLEQHLSKEEATDAFALFTTPTKNSFALDQEESLLVIAQECFVKERCKDILSNNNAHKSLELITQEFPELLRKLNNHTENYSWVYYVYAGPAYTELHFIKFLQDYLKKDIDPAQELATNKESRDNLLKRRQQILDKLQPDTSTQQLIELVGEFVWAKPRRKDYQSKSYWHMERFYREYARRIGISLRHARAATKEQITQGLLGEKVEFKQFDKQFNQHFVYSVEEGVKILVGNEAAKLFEESVQQEEATVTKTSELRGSTAYSGHAKGIIRIINKPEDMAKMNYGDVLVSVATTPSIVPAMKQASAIVSDEGGLTCHAAIVSRELKIPCVVGTKVATTALKDGDEVEVDADNGIITILTNK